MLKPCLVSWAGSTASHICFAGLRRVASIEPENFVKKIPPKAG